MDLPETLAYPREKQDSRHLQPARVELVPSESPLGTAGDARIRRAAVAASREGIRLRRELASAGLFCCG
jgi:hypothetical protein